MITTITTTHQDHHSPRPPRPPRSPAPGHPHRESFKCSTNHSQQVAKFHRNLKAVQGELLASLSSLALSDSSEHVARLQGIGEEQHFEVATYIYISNNCF